MRKLRHLAALVLAAVLALACAAPASAAFDQNTLNGIVMIRTGAPDDDGTMNYWQGTGFFVGPQGEDPQYIVTNCHVVEEFILAGKALGGGELYAVFDKDSEQEAYLVDYDAEKDVALLKLEKATDLREPLLLREPEEAMLGSEVYAVGYPLAADITIQAVTSFSKDDATVTTGSVSRFLTESGTGRRLIQTDTAMSGGNSGGPLMNLYGEVVGIVSAKYSSYSDTTVEGIGFAIPISDVQTIITDIMENGQVTDKAYMAIKAGSMTEQMAAQYNIDVTKGVFVYAVEKGGAGEKAGLQLGDVITKLNDTDITSMSDLSMAKKSYKAGDTVTLTVWRGGQEITLSLTFDQQPQTTGTEDDSSNQNQGQQDSYGDLYDYFFGRGNGGRGN